MNGKEIQISLTGFMEKNTGKFMKELWTLLLSAQNNSSGVPQQFLDAREADTKKKQVFLGSHSEVRIDDESLFSFLLSHEYFTFVAGSSNTKSRP